MSEYVNISIIGILTTLEELLFAWFPEDDEYFAENITEESPQGSFLTPVKAKKDGTSLTDSDRQSPSQRNVWKHDILNDDSNDTEPEPRTQVKRLLTTSPIMNVMQNYPLVLK